MDAIERFDEADTVTTRRRTRRYKSTARISINGFEGQALISNISMGGFCMASKTYVDINRGDAYTMQIVPEADAQVGTIEMEVQVCWTHVTQTLFTAGFKIMRSNLTLKDYITYFERKNKVR